MGGGRLTDRWARCEVGCTKASELDKPLFARIMCIHFCSLSVSSRCSFFLPFLSYTLQARTRISVCICPICINALGLRETPSRLGLHNNALGLRESTSRLGLHNNALSLRESTSRLGLHNNALYCVRLRHDLVCMNVLSLWGA